MVVNLLTFTLYALATFRIAELVAIDDGPFDIFFTLRGWSIAVNPIRKVIGEALSCVHCAGIWISFALTFTLPYTNVIEFIIYFLSIAGLQSILANCLGRTAS